MVNVFTNIGIFKKLLGCALALFALWLGHELTTSPNDPTFPSQTGKEVGKKDFGHYASYYDVSDGSVLYVAYSLRNGGGDVPREGMRFKSETVGNKKISPSDYEKSGYDMGHLVPAEDFASNKQKMEKTFSFYNCVPQTPTLNRGEWKKYENTARELSKRKKIRVVCGAIYGKSPKTIGENKIKVPEKCFKIICDASTGNVEHCLVFDNSTTANEPKTSKISNIEALLGTKLHRELFYDK